MATAPNNQVASNVLQNNAGVPKVSPAPVSTAQVGGRGSNFADILFTKKLIGADQHQKIKQESVKTGKSIERIIAEGNYIPEEEIYKLKAEIYKVPFIKVLDKKIPVEVLNRFDQETASKNQAIVFEEGPDTVKVAMVDPLDIQKIKFLSTLIGKKIDPYFADPTSINSIINTRYGAQIGSEVTEALEDVGGMVNISSTLSETESLQAEIAAAPVVRIVSMVLEFAAKNKASDVHIEPRETKIVVRYRISGVLVEKLSLPKKLGQAVVSRIKILSNLKIDEHRVPQDGRFQIKVDEDIIDIRVSIMPSVHGEKIVMRLLERGGKSLKLEDTGLRGNAYKQFREALKKTQGIILIAGPTGSGKTVTLASALKILNKPDVNIMTLENPVEIRIDGVTQVQVNDEVGLTFATGLRSFLRQDPDIIMVGEIRDAETAELAIQASLTGHLVLATIHTSSAAGAIPRLVDMGIEPFLMASTINVVAAQRLTRRICTVCKYAYEANATERKQIENVLKSIQGFNLENIIKISGGKLVLYKGKGCPRCGDTGYKGRIGIFEVFRMSDKITAMTISKDSAQNIQNQAVIEGMLTMSQDGFLKSLEGQTTISEVVRVVN